MFGNVAGTLTARPVRRLRTQLLISFTLVALVALIAAGSAVVYLMLGYRTQVTMQRLREMGASAATVAMFYERQGAAPDAIAAGVAAQLPLPAARALVLDASGTVVAESVESETVRPAAQSFTSKHLELPATGSLPAPRIFFLSPGAASPSDRVAVWRGLPGWPETNGYLFIALPTLAEGPPARTAPGRGPTGPLDRGFQVRPGPEARPGPGSGPSVGAGPGSGAQGAPGGAGGGPGPNGPGFGPVAYRIVLAIPPQGLPTARQELAPGLTVAALIALLAAVAVAWWLAGTISRPIRTVTEAMARVARGEPHQPIREVGVEEVTQLARGFNAMASAVERTQATLRDFVADASHELRTPLTAIQGFSQAVVDGVLDAPPPTRDAAGLIQREAERMRRLVEDLLLLSKMEARDRAGLRAPVDVADLLDTLVQRTELVGRGRELQMLLAVPDHLLVEGDANQLEHLFGNLLDNAAKYSPDGGTVTVRATVERGAVPGGGRAVQPFALAARGAGRLLPAGHVVVTVHNSGSHIPPEDLPHIFERFYRVDKSRSRAVAGSGLGLAIAKEVAERHGGTIRAASDPVAGTTFTVTLPALPEPAEAPAVVANPPRRGLLPRPRSGATAASLANRGAGA